MRPFGIGLRFDITDPVSGRTNFVLITPLAVPGPPVVPFRKIVDRDAERLSAVDCDVRFSFAPETFSFELRVPLDVLEIGAIEKKYLITFALWDIGENRAIAAWPMDERSANVEPTPAILESEGAWGAAEDAQAALPPNDAFQLLEDAGRRVESGPAFATSAGWVDGKRNDAELAAFEERAARVAAARPDLVSARVLLAQLRLARNDMAGALKALDEVEADLPPFANTPSQILVRMQLFREACRFDEALAALARAGAVEKEPLLLREKVVLEGLREAWRAEQEIRKAEAKRDDLPRVLLETTKGEIEIELFEDDAPNGVANFVSLVESGFYEGTRFHWVDGGGRVIGGDPNSRNEDPHDDGFGDPGYLIESEPGRRMIFPLTVSYSDKRRQRRTEGCAFVIHLAPWPEGDGINTVFGRVVKGEDVVRKLEYLDAIKKTKVLRKRPHPYLPAKRVLGTG
jgi:cyclophilin family peptidyl-prolyl cis-trans isomerase